MRQHEKDWASGPVWKLSSACNMKPSPISRGTSGSGAIQFWVKMNRHENIVDEPVSDMSKSASMRSTVCEAYREASRTPTIVAARIEKSSADNLVITSRWEKTTKLIYCCWFRWSQTNLASQQKLSFTKTHQVHTDTFQQVKMQIGLIFDLNIEGARDASGAGDWKGARHKDWRHSCRRQVDFKLKRILRWTIEHIITFWFPF